MERHFHEELKELHAELLRMAVLVEESIGKSVESLKNRDRRQAQGVIDSDAKIDELELDVDERCIDLIARYQPVAGDLRFITTGMKINAELERIADLAVDICQRVLDISDLPLLKPLIDIPKLSVIAQTMVRQSIDAFIRKDEALAKTVVLSDPEADRLRNMVQQELINDYLSKDPATASRAVALLLVARHLERICDHATNIAEDAIYMINGKVIKHHPEKIKESN